MTPPGSETTDPETDAPADTDRRQTGAPADPLSVGVLGYGFVGRAHANALARLPMFFPDAPAVERSVLVGRDEAALADAADRLGFESTATDWRDVVDTVDIFYNLGPNHLHAEPSIAALDAGTHVLCEKPLATTLEAAERMRDAARDVADEKAREVDGVRPEVTECAAPGQFLRVTPRPRRVGVRQPVLEVPPADVADLP